MDATFSSEALLSADESMTSNVMTHTQIKVNSTYRVSYQLSDNSIFGHA